MVTIPEGSISIFANSGGQITDFSSAFDEESRTLVIDLPKLITFDIITLVLDYSITGPTGLELDGELAQGDAFALPSGDGIRGGKAVLRYRILNGDTNDDSTVDSDDLNIVLGEFGGPGIAGDLNDDGLVDSDDLNLVLGSFGKSITNGSAPPVQPLAITPSPAQVLGEPLASVSVVYSGPLDPARIDPDDLFVIEAGAQLRRADAAELTANNTIVFSFDPPLAQCSAYTLNLSNAIASAEGAVALRPPSPPVLTGLTPPPVPTIDPVASPTTAQTVTISGLAPNAATARIIGPELVYIVPVIAGEYEAIVELPTDQVHTIFVSGVSACGIIGPSASIQITRDTSPPMVIIDFPLNGQEVTTPTVTVTGRVSDEFSGLDGLTVSVNGAPASVGTGPGGQGTFVAMGIPLTIGTQAIQVLATDALGNARTESIMVTRIEVPPGSPTIEALSGDAQSAQVRTELAQPIEVLLKSPNAQPLGNKVVTFTIDRNNGTLRAQPNSGSDPGLVNLQVFTNSQGIARAYWTLGNTAGAAANRVRITSASMVGTVFFCADGIPAPADRILVGDHNNQRGETGGQLAQPLTAYVTDGAAGNPAAGVPVTFTITRGDGQFTNAAQQITVITGSDGRAATPFLLGDTPGLNRVQATFEGNPGLPATFNATGIARIEGQPTTVSGIVQDNAGRAIGGALATLTVVLDFPKGSQQVILGPVTTGIDGRFVFDASLIPAGTLNTDIPAGPGKVLVSGVFATSVGGEPIDREWAFPYVGYDILIVESADNAMQDPVWLPELDPANEVLYDGTQDVTLTIAGIDGLEFRVKAGSMILEDGTVPTPSSPEIIRLNQVHFDEVPMPLPDGNAVPFAWTLQPKNATFDPPIEITLPNMTAEPPGTIVQLLQWNNDTADFQTIGTGQVSADGSVVVSEVGSGIRVAGWGGWTPPPPPTGTASNCGPPSTNGCGPGFTTTLSLEYAQNLIIPEGFVFVDGIIPKYVSFNDIGCENHDICYGTPGTTKAECDVALLFDLLSTCDQSLVFLNGKTACYGWAWIYYAAVSLGGEEAFERGREEALACSRNGTWIPDHDPALGVPMPPYKDSDLDGMPDDWELDNGYNPFDPQDTLFDDDADGLPTCIEFASGNDPLDSDTDGNGLLDGEQLLLDTASPTIALDNTWDLRIAGRSVLCGPGGRFTASDVPASSSLVRLTGSRTNSPYGTGYVASDYVIVNANDEVSLERLHFADRPFQTPISLTASAPTTVLEPGQQTQLTTTGSMPDGTAADLTLRTNGTTYTSTNPAVSSVSDDGLVFAHTNGTVFITVVNEGVSATRRIDVVEQAITTTITGIAQFEDGTPAVGAVVTLLSFGGEATTGEDGSFALHATLPASSSSITIIATLSQGEQQLVATATGLKPVTNGFTDAGVLTLLQLCNPEWAPLGPGINNQVNALAVFDDGSGPMLYAGGAFTQAGGIPASFVARWDGAMWTSLGAGVNNPVNAVAVFDDGNGPALYAGGEFTQAGGVPANFVARWDGAAWSPLGSGMNSVVYGLTVFEDGNGPALYTGGEFTQAGGVPANFVARWDGQTWSPLGSGVSFLGIPGLGWVYALTVFESGTRPALVVGGRFTQAGGQPANSVATWDGTAWSPLGTGLDGGFGLVNALTSFDDGSGPALYAGGQFTLAGVSPGIARWNGEEWAPLGTGVNSLVSALTVFDDGSGPALYAGGLFTQAGGTPANYIARWDGGSWSPLGAGVSDLVLALVGVHQGSGSALFAGGAFGQAGGLTSAYIAKWFRPTDCNSDAEGDARALAEGRSHVPGPIRRIVDHRRVPRGDGAAGSGLVGPLGENGAVMLPSTRPTARGGAGDGPDGRLGDDRAEGAARDAELLVIDAPARRIVAEVVRAEVAGPEATLALQAASDGAALADAAGRRAEVRLDLKHGVPRAALVDGDGAARSIPALPGTTSSRPIAMNTRGMVAGVGMMSEPAGGGSCGFIYCPERDLLMPFGTPGNGSGEPTLWLTDELLLGWADDGASGPRLVLWSEPDGLLDLDAGVRERFPEWAYTLTGVLGVLEDGAVLAEGLDVAGQPMAARLELRVFERTPGDINADGVVDQRDVEFVVGAIQRGDLAGDANGDGVVNAEDLSPVVREFGREARVLVPVPEPMLEGALP
ncbi:MAG: Ig-like domain-containing protein [Phycisphaerales bacterium]